MTNNSEIRYYYYTLYFLKILVVKVQCIVQVNSYYNSSFNLKSLREKSPCILILLLYERLNRTLTLLKVLMTILQLIFYNIKHLPQTDAQRT